MLKFEGQNGIDLMWVLGRLQTQFGLSSQQTKKLFVEACCRNVVLAELESMIEYILEEQKRSKGQCV